MVRVVAYKPELFTFILRFLRVWENSASCQDGGSANIIWCGQRNFRISNRVILTVVEKRMLRRDAAYQLNLAERQTHRLMNRFSESVVA